MTTTPGNLSPNPQPVLPKLPIDRLISPIVRFMHVEAMGGIVLLLSAIAALALANSPLSKDFLSIWKTPVGFQVGDFVFRYPLYHLINDGLMVIFFFVVGLEVKRELVHGELRGVRKAALPLAAALGGMLVPAGIYLLFQAGTPGQRGWGIPMATDIAFVVGCMAILGRRVPHGLRVLLLSLAIADDIGAILVIAIGYSSGLNLTALLIGFGGFGLIYFLSRLGVRSFLVYTIVGIAIWFAFHESGVHATIAGVILGLMTPARSSLGPEFVRNFFSRVSNTFYGEDFNDEGERIDAIRMQRLVAREAVSPLAYLIHVLHPWVSFIIMPIFALANAGVPFKFSDLGSPISLAVMAGLFFGKPIGVTLASWLAVKLRLAQLPPGVSMLQIVGGGILAGIGFTMALFIAGLALGNPLLDQAKVGILMASVLAAIVGMVVLTMAASRHPSQGESVEDPAQVPQPV